MENLPTIGDAKLGDIFFRDALAPLWPVTIVRPLKLFPKSLGLTPGAEAVPSPEFLVRILSDHPTHQALIRAQSGEHFKNFENHVRGRHRASPTTLKAIAEKMGVNESDIATMAHGRSDGPLLPNVLSLIGLVEAIPNRFFAAAVKLGIPCPHCGGNLIDDRDSWWQSQALQLPKPAYRLVERLLGALLVGTGLYAVLQAIERYAPVDQIVQLAHPSKHPFGNWLGRVMESRGIQKYSELCDAPSGDGTSLPFDENRLSKWASGGELLPLAMGKRMTAGLADANALELDLIAARALAFIIDLATAAAECETAPPRKLVQATIHRRLETLHNHAIILVREVQKTRRKTAHSEQP